MHVWGRRKAENYFFLKFLMAVIDLLNIVSRNVTVYKNAAMILNELLYLQISILK
jgi:hypothetical protein